MFSLRHTCTGMDIEGYRSPSNKSTDLAIAILLSVPLTHTLERNSSHFTKS